MFEDFLKNKKKWLNLKGFRSQIVISSRLRLARNIKDYPFPARANIKQKEKILQELKEIYPQVKEFNPAIFVKMDELDLLDRQFLLERHLVSQEHMTDLRGTGLIISLDEKLSLMINEEDHIRLQVLLPGFDLERMWRLINRVDDVLSEKISFAFLPDIGYLTSCITNVGTALRASCMLHLPALILTKRINKIFELLTKLSFTARGLFGEGTQALGNFFQISNQVSLGLSEKELIDNLYGIVVQIEEQEESAREVLLKKHKNNLEDSVWRALGILRTARLITTKEALSHLSLLRLGLDLGIIKRIKTNLINNLFIVIQPAHLQKIEGRILGEKERDYIRAVFLRHKLKGNLAD